MTAPDRMSAAEYRIRPRPEYAIQAEIVAALRRLLPDCLVHASPNGARHNAREGAKLKYTGTLSGWPDLEIVTADGRVHFIEVKNSKGSLSLQQRSIREFCKLGTPWALCRSVEEAIEAVTGWGLVPAALDNARGGE